MYNYITVLEETPNGERAYDIFSRLNKDRIVMLTGEVNDRSANLIIAQMLYLNSQDNSKDIHFYINSPGGVVTAGLGIYDTMNFVTCDVSTTVVGQACSMGAFLASAGAKGKRYITPSSRFMIHQVLGGAQGQATDVQIQNNEMQRLKEYLNKCLAKHTGQKLAKIRKDTERDYFLDAEESVKYGLADKVLGK